MARTRIDPWQTEQPAELMWWDSALSTIIPESPKYSSPSPPPLPSPSPPPSSYSLSSTKYLTKPSSNIISFLSKSKSLPPPPSYPKTSPPKKPPPAKPIPKSSTTNPSSKILSSISLPLSSHSNVIHPKSKSPNPYFLPYSESKAKRRISGKHKTSTQHGGKVSKPKPKPKSKMDLETAALKTLNESHWSESFVDSSDTNLKYTYPLKNSSELPDGDIRKNMVPKIILRDIGGLISKVCPKLSSESSPSSVSSSPPVPSSSRSTPVYGNVISPAPPTTPESPRPPVLFPVSPLKCLSSLLVHPKGDTSDNIPAVEPDVPQIFLDPPVVTLEEEPPVLTSDRPLARTVTGISMIAKNSMTRLSVSPKKSPSSSEKSSTPISKKSLIFEVLEAVAPALTKSETIQSSSVLTCSSKSTPSYPIESNSSLSSKSDSQFSHFKLDSPKPTVTRSLRSSNISYKLSLKPEETHYGELSKPKSERVKLSDENSSKLKSLLLKNGFLGFPKEDGKRLTKTRFHVDTNILASSLDLLDLQKHAGTSTGSPTTCCHCNIIFSSVKHCKYHQSVTSSDVIDLTCPQTVQEDGFWLCPWCPVICTAVEFLSKHKLVCREKGRCQQDEKTSSASQRKSAPSSSRRRTTGPAILSSSTTTLPALLRPNNSFKVVHGIVLPL